jgi:hypothetical protein
MTKHQQVKMIMRFAGCNNDNVKLASLIQNRYARAMPEQQKALSEPLLCRQSGCSINS